MPKKLNRQQLKKLKGYIDKKFDWMDKAKKAAYFRAMPTLDANDYKEGAQKIKKLFE